MSSTAQAHQRKGPPIHNAVVDAILDDVTTGKLAVGGALPPERTLAQQLSVSRSSVREALRVLQHAGVVDIRAGSGTYLVDGGSRAALLRAQAVAAGEHSPLDLIVARAAIEPACAEAAAVSHHAGDIVAIRSALDEQTARTNAGDDPSRADADFHLAVAAASHNGVLLLVEQTILNLMDEDLWKELKGRTREGSEHEYLEHHILILQAIENRDARRARSLMAMHMCAVESGMLGQLENSLPSRPELDPELQANSSVAASTST